MLPDPLRAIGVTTAFQAELSGSGDLVLARGASVLAANPDRPTLVEAFSEMGSECLRLRVRPADG
jgi:hypothetical protein